MKSLLRILVLGLFVFPSHSIAQQSARKIADVREVNCDNAKGYLDYLSNELHKDPAAKTLIIFYGGRTYLNAFSTRRLLPKRGEAEARVSFWKTYLVNARSIDASRIEVICGGYRERPVVELWIVPHEATPSTPSPTLSEKDIKFRRGVPKDRDIFGEDDCSSIKGGTIVPCSTEAGTFKSTANHNVSITFTGRVTSIEMLGARKQKVIPVDFDPRFAVVVHIESATPQETPLKAGAKEIFAIHSPSRLFLESEEHVIGKKYRFQLTWEKVDNGSRFSQLSASLLEW